MGMRRPRLWEWIVLSLVFLVILAIAIPGLLQSQRASGERSFTSDLKTISSAQADFRAMDRDGNGKNDFWRADIAGLYAVKSKDGSMIKLIETRIALADDRPVTDLSAVGKKSPRSGYWFRSIRNADEKSPDPDRFAAVAFPARYPDSKNTVIINENNTMFIRDLGHGNAIDAFPVDTAATGWRKLD